MVSLVCIDVDGTLVGASGVVPLEVWAAAERARARGIRLAVCSGRPAFGLAREYAELLDGRGWHVFQNGASVMHAASGESRSRDLPPDALAWLVGRAGETGRILELYTDAEYAVESGADRARRHAGLLGVPFRPRAFGSLRGPAVRAQWLLPRAEADAVLAEPHPELNLALSHSPVMPDTAFVNVTPRGVDKASAVGMLAEVYGVPLEGVMMVGDGFNDVPAMRVVGHPVAMGNAEPEVQMEARHVVGHVDGGGLVEALELAVRLREGEGRETPAA
jgi:Cof subfamily protein (haloacid dehalogenase superfamily)